jgi:hypothetical protein
MLVFEHLNLPKRKDGEGCGGFAVWHVGTRRVGTRHVSPLTLNSKTTTLVWLDIGNAQLFLNVAPKTNGVSTLDEEVSHRFRGLLAKGDHPCFWRRSAVHK